MRLQAFLARAGASPSRRKAEALISAGRVSVNGEAATLGATVSPHDSVLIEQIDVLGRAFLGLTLACASRAATARPSRTSCLPCKA